MEIQNGAKLTVRESQMAAFVNEGRVADTFGPGSVSYTHLRAHETVLDLVCRLLLEKKNKNQNTNKYLQQQLGIQPPYLLITLHRPIDRTKHHA